MQKHYKYLLPNWYNKHFSTKALAHIIPKQLTAETFQGTRTMDGTTQYTLKGHLVNLHSLAATE